MEGISLGIKIGKNNKFLKSIILLISLSITMIIGFIFGILFINKM